MGNCLSVCLSVRSLKELKKVEKKKPKRSAVSPSGARVTCCCNNSDVQQIYDEISIEDIEI